MPSIVAARSCVAPPSCLRWRSWPLLTIALIALIGAIAYTLEGGLPPGSPFSAPTFLTRAAYASQSSTPTPQHATHDIGGKITDAAGAPIKNAWVAAGDAFVFTSHDGLFRFDDPKVGGARELRVFAAGYYEQVLPAPRDGAPVHVTLELQPIKAIYLNPNVTRTDADVDRLIGLINTTELNAVVIDIKEQHVFYDTGVPFFQEAGTVAPILDVPAMLQKMQDNDVYTIARLVVFKDGLVAEKYQHLGVRDSQTGNLWRDQTGAAWVNPMLEDVWNANLELAYEAATLGFDEIQYDYVRFPTDGDMSRVDYGLENTQEVRERSIETFLRMSHQRLIPTGVKLSADVFGYTVMVNHDLSIGQNFVELSKHVDYVSPMLYPSHWPRDSIAVNGHPNDFPYETIHISMTSAVHKLEGNGLKIRPWLQDFTYPGLQPFDEADVRAQIDAAEAVGVSGWMLWDPNNWYHAGALKPESPAEALSPTAAPQAVSDRNRATTTVRRGR